MVSYVLPDVGEYKDPSGNIVKNLKMGPNIIVAVSTGVLTIDIPFSHPDLQEDRYSIRIVAPIDYISRGSTDVLNDFKLQ